MIRELVLGLVVEGCASTTQYRVPRNQNNVQCARAQHTGNRWAPPTTIYICDTNKDLRVDWIVSDNIIAGVACPKGIYSRDDTQFPELYRGCPLPEDAWTAAQQVYDKVWKK